MNNIHKFQIYTYETNRIIESVLSNVAKFNNIHSKICFESTSDNLKESIRNNNDNVSFQVFIFLPSSYLFLKVYLFVLQVSLIVAEPFFSSSILPWHNLQFWYIRDRLLEVLPKNVKIIPSSAKFYIMAVQFKDLWKIRAPVQSVEGFSLKPFDEIIQVSAHLLGTRI